MITVKIRVSLKAKEIREWLLENVGSWDDHTWHVTLVKEWWVFEFESEQDATAFILRWS